MRRLFGFGLLFVVGAVLGGAAVHFMLNSPMGEDSTEGSSSESEILYWVAPMDPNYRRDKPGKSPMGMDLVPVYAGEGTADESTVTISPTVQQNLGVRTAAAQRSRLERRVRTVGYVEYDETALHHVHTRVDGWVESLSVKAEGDPIKKGQVLFELYSPTLVNAQQEYVISSASDNTDLLRASAERLSALGMTEEEIRTLHDSGEIRQRVRAFARSDGVIASLGVREGIYVTPSTHVMSVAELDQVWIVAEVFERQASLVQLGQRVEFRLDSLPGRVWTGEVNYIYPELDPVTRSLRLRISFDSQDEVLRPNMFVRVTIFVPGNQSVVHVPRESVIRGGVADRVVLVLGDGKFRAAPVVVGVEADDRVEIVRGIERGDEVVVSGQFLIDSESNIDSALARFSEADSTQAERATVDATIRGANHEKGTLRVKHGAIPKWSWMSMTMNLAVDDPSLLTKAKSGQSVRLVIEKRDRKFVIVDVTVDESTDENASDSSSGG